MAKRLRIDLNYLAKTYGLDLLLTAYIESDGEKSLLVIEGDKRV